MRGDGDDGQRNGKLAEDEHMWKPETAEGRSDCGRFSSSRAAVLEQENFVLQMFFSAPQEFVVDWFLVLRSGGKFLETIKPS